jgi:hypothetical protein
MSVTWVLFFLKVEIVLCYLYYDLPVGIGSYHGQYAGTTQVYARHPRGATSNTHEVSHIYPILLRPGATTT